MGISDIFQGFILMPPQNLTPNAKPRERLGFLWEFLGFSQACVSLVPLQTQGNIGTFMGIFFLFMSLNIPVPPQTLGFLWDFLDFFFGFFGISCS